MNVLKLTVNKRFLKILPVAKHQKCYVQLSEVKQAEPKPVLMSYATYETTKSAKSPTPPLIVMHGLFGSKGNWNSLCKAMLNKSKPTRKIIAVDARNHGDSPHNPIHSYEAMAVDIKHLMQVQKIPKAIIMGHSMGGKASLYFALKYSNLVERLIVVDMVPTAKSGFVKETLLMCHVMNKMKLKPKVPISTARVEADKILAKTVKDKGVRAFLLTNLVKKADGSFGWRLNLNALINNFPILAQFPNVGATKFNNPTLFIKGGLSDFVQKQDMVRAKIQFPKAQFVTIPKAGHWVHSEQPNEFLVQVLKFINKEDGMLRAKELFPAAEFATMEDAGHWCHADNPNEFLDIVMKFINEES